jgi:hypothetical protein
VTGDAASVTYNGKSWSLFDGQILTFGREPDRHIQINDPYVSGRAGLFVVTSSVPSVRNDSQSHGLTIVAAQQEHTIARAVGGPGDLHPLPTGSSEVRLIGSFRKIVLGFDSGALGRPSVGGDGGDRRIVDPTLLIRDRLDEDDRRVLAALCEPLLRSGGVGRPRNTKEVGARLRLAVLGEALGTDPKEAMRKRAEYRLTKLRFKLNEFGADGLIVDGEIRRPNDNFVEKLAIDAFSHGWVRLEDCSLLP